MADSDASFSSVQLKEGSAWISESARLIFLLLSVLNLSILNVKEGFDYQVPLHVTLPKGEETGPATRALFDLLILDASRRQNG